jgi:curved DNA-binding protein CbpA
MPVSGAKSKYYAILEVSPDATLDEIKRSYRRLALTRHPDKHRDNPNAKEEFQQVSVIFNQTR